MLRRLLTAILGPLRASTRVRECEGGLHSWHIVGEKVLPCSKCRMPFPGQRRKFE